MPLNPMARRSRVPRFIALIGAGALVSAAAALLAGPPIIAQASGLSVRIVGNHFVDGSGRTVRLLGVNRSGSEYACMANWAIFDGPSDTASIAAMASWNIDAVRVPLNEDCWLGINGAPAAFSGANYRNAIAGYVSRLHAAGMYAIVDLHWNAQGSLPADGKTGQGRKMADLDHSPAYWSSVASFFKNDHGVIFDLFNEPHDISWDCWLNGCTTSDGTGTWQAAGMQTLLNAVRVTGATNVVTLSANGWGGDIPQWLNYRPHDPIGQIAAGWHVYFPETYYSDPSRWNASVLPVAQQVPIATTELGEHDCADGWMKQFLPWADQHGLSYTAWTWNNWPDCSNPVLITKYDGTPSGYGIGYRDHLRSLAGFKPVVSQLSSGRSAGSAALSKRTPAVARSSARQPAAIAAATAAAIVHRRSGTAASLTTAAGALVPSPRRTTLIGVGSILLLSAPLALAGTLWFLRRRRRRRAAAAVGADQPVATAVAGPSQA
jgi:endoglucanase